MQVFSNSHSHYKELKKLKGFVIVIEGPIGVGKTTFGTAFANFLNKNEIQAKFFPEFVNNNILSMFLGNPEKHGPMFQMLMMEQRKETYRKAYDLARKHNFVSIIDRSLEGDYAFALANKDTFNEFEWNRYIENVGGIKREFSRPDFTIFLEVDIDESMRRIQSRNRQGEDSYTKEYLSKIHKTYNQVLDAGHTRINFTEEYKNLTEQNLLDIINKLNF